MKIFFSFPGISNNYIVISNYIIFKYLTKKIERDEVITIEKETKTSKQSVNINAGKESLTTISTNFRKLVEKITKKNIFRPYPDINDIPN